MSIGTGTQPLRALPRERLIDRATEAIKEFILANELKGGDRLPSEQELARALGVSRNVVRQSVSVLETIGVVRASRGRGIYVADLADTDVFRQLGAWINLASLNNREYLEVRSIFEHGIFKLVMDRASDEDLDRIEAIARAMAEGTDDAELHRLHDEFHQLLLATPGNAFLVTMGTILYRFFWNVASTGPKVHQVDGPGLRGSHLSIARLLRRRCPDDLPTLIDLHLGIRSPGDLTSNPRNATATDTASRVNHVIPA